MKKRLVAVMATVVIILTQCVQSDKAGEEYADKPNGSESGSKRTFSFYNSSPITGISFPERTKALHENSGKQPAEYAAQEKRETGESASAVVSAEQGGVVELGEARIEVPAGALEEDTEITITRLYATEDAGQLTNATAGGGGYRFLPAGQQFKEAAVIKLPYSAELEGKPAALEELTTYYYDKDVGSWEALERVGIEAGVVVSLTTHFTDMINGTLTLPEGAEALSFNINSIKGLEAADPSSGVLQIEGLEGNNSGSASFRINLAVPAGRAGMTPQVAVGYSSEGGNGVMGKGWSLETGSEITYDTRRGLPEYEAPASERGPFMLDGVVLEREGSSQSPYRYRALKESGFEEIDHYVNVGED